MSQESFSARPVRTQLSHHGERSIMHTPVGYYRVLLHYCNKETMNTVSWFLALKIFGPTGRSGQTKYLQESLPSQQRLVRHMMCKSRCH